MSEGRWTPDVWERGDAAARRLPRVDDLPLAEQGFDQEAVRAAFDSFYRHAAELDATLRLLESVEVFGTQARELRAEIRSLRAASWGPLPQRHVWAAARGSSVPARAGGGLPSSLPRLAVEAAFIVLVAVGAALADLSVGLIVLLVLAAWLIVGVAEFAASTRRATPRPGLLPAPARREEGPVAEQAAPAPAESTGQATMIEPAPVAEPAEQPEPSEVAPDEPEAERARPVVQAEPTSRRGWFRRKRPAEPEPVPTVQSKHVRVLSFEAANGESAAVADPWEQKPDLHPGEIDVAEAPAAEAEPEREPAEPAADELPLSSRWAFAESERSEAMEPAAEKEPEPVPAEAEAAPREALAPHAWPTPESRGAEDVEPEPEGAAEPEPEPADSTEEPVVSYAAEAEPEQPIWAVELPENLEADVGGEAPESAFPEREGAGDEPFVDELQAEREMDPQPDAALAEFEPSSREPAGRRRFWRRRQREPETEPTPEPIPEASPFESEPAAEGAVAEGKPAHGEEQSPLPEAAPFQPEVEEERREEVAMAAAEPASDSDQAVEVPRERRRLWSRVRREKATAPEPTPPPPHVERIEVEQAIDPLRAVALWGESAFGADPKPGDTWIHPLDVGGSEPEEDAGAQSEPAAEEAHADEATPESHGAEAPPIAAVVRARSRGQVGLRRGRR